MDKYYYSKSKRFAIAIFCVHSIMSFMALWFRMGDVVIALMASGTGFATGLYANKQYQDRKKQEIEKNSNGHIEKAT